MSTAKEEVEALLDKLPDNCSLEDIQYHLSIVRTELSGDSRIVPEIFKLRMIYYCCWL